MSLSALRSVGDAIDVTREFMRPLSARRWGTLALIVAFMGTAGTPVPANPQFFDPLLWRPPDETQPGPNDAAAPPSDVLDPSVLADPPAWAIAVLIAAVVFAALYVIVGVLMRFVFVDALRTKRAAVLAPGWKHLRGAVGVLAFRVVVWALALPPIVGILFVSTGLGPEPLSSTVIAVVGMLAAAVLSLLWIVDAVTLQFVIPVMIAQEQGVLASWRELWPTLVDEWAEYVVYGIVRLVVGVAVGIVAALAVVVVLFGVGIVLGTIAGLVILLSGGLAGLETGTLVVLGMLVLLFVLAAIVTFATVNVPFQAYLWYYALLVLGDTNPEFDLIPDLRATVRDDNGVGAV